MNQINEKRIVVLAIKNCKDCPRFLSRDSGRTPGCRYVHEGKEELGVGIPERCPISNIRQYACCHVNIKDYIMVGNEKIFIEESK